MQYRPLAGADMSHYLLNATLYETVHIMKFYFSISEILTRGRPQK